MVEREPLKSFLETIKENTYGNQLTISYQPSFLYLQDIYRKLWLVYY